MNKKNLLNIINVASETLKTSGVVESQNVLDKLLSEATASVQDSTNGSNANDKNAEKSIKGKVIKNKSTNTNGNNNTNENNLVEKTKTFLVEYIKKGISTDSKERASVDIYDFPNVLYPETLLKELSVPEMMHKTVLSDICNTGIITNDRGLLRINNILVAEVLCDNGKVAKFKSIIPSMSRYLNVKKTCDKYVIEIKYYNNNENTKEKANTLTLFEDTVEVDDFSTYTVEVLGQMYSLVEFINSFGFKGVTNKSGYVKSSGTIGAMAMTTVAETVTTGDTNSNNNKKVTPPNGVKNK